MKKPEVLLQKLEIKRARTHAFWWGTWVGLIAGGALMLFIERTLERMP